MKGYKTFLGVFLTLLVVYILAEVNKPKPLDWTVTLSKNDKNPYGGYVLFNQLKSIFPSASIQPYSLPLYDQLNNYSATNSAYILLADELQVSKNDWDEMRNYVEMGNYIFASASSFNKLLADSLGLATKRMLSLLSTDSTSLNFVNPTIKTAVSTTFKRQTIDEYFSKIDTSRTTIVGVNNRNHPNYIRISYGKGAFIIHSNPLCFSNYFMLSKNNATYTATALSYLPESITKIYWDEYYKSGKSEVRTPLRFFLSNEYLLWALRLTLIGLILYVLFEMKRKQRIIPVIAPLRNTTVDFIKTVSSVYFNQKDNGSIADKKILYFLDYVRQHFYLPTQILNEEFAESLSKKSGVERENIDYILRLINEVNQGYPVNDKRLLALNTYIDNFYKQAK